MSSFSFKFSKPSHRSKSESIFMLLSEEATPLLSFGIAVLLNFSHPLVRSPREESEKQPKYACISCGEWPLLVLL
jgi:hypothetical protein